MASLPESGDRPITSVFLDVIKNVELIIHSEIHLAKEELRGEFNKANQAAKLLGAGATLATLALTFMLLSCVYLLATAMEFWIAALLVALATGAVAAILITIGIAKMKRIRPAPQRAIASVKENMTWTKAKTR